MKLEDILHEKEMTTLHLEADKAKAEGLYLSTRSLEHSRLGIKMPKLPEFHEVEDGIDAYMTRFERYEENAGWRKEDYALVLSSSITFFNGPNIRSILPPPHWRYE